MKLSALQRKVPLRSGDGKARVSVPVPKAKKCRACKESFLAVRPMQIACSGPCAAVLAIAKRQKADLAADREKRAKLKTRSQWMAEAQQAFNAWVRARDAALPCVSCGRYHDGQWHSGHYLSTGARPELRFDENNCWRQCQPCNTHLHGNLVLYRAELIRRRGLAEVERLEGPQAPRKYTSEALKEIRDTYRRRARELKGAT